VSTTPRHGISFIIPCFNCGSYILEAVESVTAQPLTIRFEIIVIDDGSDEENTLAALHECSQRDAVRMVRLPANSGAQRARTTGLRAARYEHVMVLDCDDLLCTDPAQLAAGTYPQQAVQILTDDPEVAFVHTFSRMFGDFHGLTISAYPTDEASIVRKHHVPMPIVYRRRDGLAAGGYDPAIGKWQDWAFAIDLLATRYRRGAGNHVRCVPGPHHQYRIHTRWERLSTAQTSELDMTTLVIERNLDYFQAALHDRRPVEDLARRVCESKPDRLTELLHMAAFDLDQALTVATQREFTLSSPYEPLGIP